MGYLRPSPKARRVSFGPRWRLPALVFGDVDQLLDAFDQGAVEPLFRPSPPPSSSCSRPAPSIMRVEHRIGRQAVLVGLVRPKFGARRLVDDVGGITSPDGPRLSPGTLALRQRGEPVDLHLQHVLERIVAAVHVAVEGGVADRHFRLVAGGQQHARRVCWRSPSAPAPRMRDWMFSSAVSGGRSPNSCFSSYERLVDRRADGHDVVADAQALGALLGVAESFPPTCSGRAA